MSRSHCHCDRSFVCAHEIGLDPSHPNDLRHSRFICWRLHSRKQPDVAVAYRIEKLEEVLPIALRIDVNM